MPLFHKSLYVHLVVVSVRALGWTIKLTLCRQTINAILKEVVSAERSRPVLVDKENSRSLRQMNEERQRIYACQASDATVQMRTRQI